MSEPIVLHVNGQSHHIQASPETPLIFVLRNDLGLKSVKLACGLEQCGACLVLLDGQAAPSCRLPVASVQGREITTLEGLSAAGRLHPVQEAFLAEQAAQCGYCTAGMIVAAAALLAHTPHPSHEQIRTALARNLCRCGAYRRILKAVRRAAEGGRP